MSLIRVHDYLNRPIAVSRESAHLLTPLIRQQASALEGAVELDFDRIEGLTPSFLDELLSIIEKAATGKSWRARAINVPAPFSPKFQAVCRARKARAVIEGRQWALSGETVRSTV